MRKLSFRHFDGAVQYFNNQDYIARRDSDFNYDNKSKAQVKANYEKIFKINGVIGVKQWVELCCHYFTGNPLIHEYFTGSLPERIISKIEKLRSIKT
jgi:hypothetical protein